MASKRLTPLQQLMFDALRESVALMQSATLNPEEANHLERANALLLAASVWSGVEEILGDLRAGRGDAAESVDRIRLAAEALDGRLTSARPAQRDGRMVAEVATRAAEILRAHDDSTGNAETSDTQLALERALGELRERHPALAHALVTARSGRGVSAVEELETSTAQLHAGGEQKLAHEGVFEAAKSVGATSAASVENFLRHLKK